MRLHPTFYVGRLKPDFPVDIPDLQPRLRGRARSSTFQNADAVGGSAQDAAARATTRLLTVGSLQKPQALKQLPTISLLTRCELRRITRLPLRAFRQVIRIQGVVSRLLRVGHHQSILLNRQPLQVLRRLGAPQSSNSRRNRRNWRTSRVTVRKCPFDVMVRSSIAMVRPHLLMRRARAAGLGSKLLPTTFLRAARRLLATVQSPIKRNTLRAPQRSTIGPARWDIHQWRIHGRHVAACLKNSQTW
ncbi:hypothetical protein PI125_g20417 [Phytophthora idaei]|nr:hypothetical protein PI125_g20417 [Phytophthora idaei]